MNTDRYHRTVKPMFQMTPRSTRNRRAVAFIYFLIIGVPMALLGFAVAVDVSTMVSARRAVQLVAESASVAGSFQYERNGSGVLDSARAVSAAHQLCERALAVGALPSRNVELTGPVSNWCSALPSPVTSPTSVQVSINYEVRGTLVLRNLGTYLGFDIYDKLKPISTVEAGSLCNPQNPGDLGRCYRPSTGVVQVLDDIAEKSGVPLGNDAVVPEAPKFDPEPASEYYPYHYAGHYPSHYPAHYAQHYPAHYAQHYPAHYTNHYTSGGKESTTTTTQPCNPRISGTCIR
jgi:hypothetical protein